MYKKDLELQKNWQKLLSFLKQQWGIRPKNIKAVLFLIGIQELGQGAKNFSKEQKLDLMHIATCKILSLSGFYELEGLDEEGWPHWKLVKELPHFDLIEQEKLLKMHVLEYFHKELNITF